MTVDEDEKLWDGVPDITAEESDFVENGGSEPRTARNRADQCEALITIV